MAPPNSPKRCPWVDLSKPDYVAYHDEEWGVPVHDDRRIFEFLVLEAAQAGLSWYTVLRKRNRLRTHADYPATSPESDALSADLRKRGFKFVGSTICYAHMQATGMVNVYTTVCFRHRRV